MASGPRRPAGRLAAVAWRAVRRRSGSVRVRSTAAAVVVVAAALALGGIGLVAAVRASLTEGVEQAAAAQAGDLASLLRVGQLPATLPSGRGDVITQVVGPGGRVVAASAGEGAAPVSAARPGEDGLVLRHLPGTDPVTRLVGDHDDDGPYLLLSQQVALPSGTDTVYVAGSLASVRLATHLVGVALAFGLPALLLLVGGLVWSLTGRALRPVEGIRSEVADISGHRDLHRRVPLPSAEDEVRRLAETMNGMLDRLEASASAQRRFVGDASHELRSPLAALRATLEVALPGAAAERQGVADALAETARLQSMVEDLLVLARVDEGGPLLVRRGPVDLDDVVVDAARRARTTSPVPVDLRRVSAGRVLGDRSGLGRVVQNLVDNACRHARSQVWVGLAVEGDEVVLTVDDDGAGVPTEARRRIFERFARLEQSRGEAAPAGGAGLGLAIVDELVRAHGGTVAAVDGAPGARFEVRLPALDTDADAGQPGADADQPGADADQPGAGAPGEGRPALSGGPAAGA